MERFAATTQPPHRISLSKCAKVSLCNLVGNCSKLSADLVETAAAFSIHQINR